MKLFCIGVNKNKALKPTEKNKIDVAISVLERIESRRGIKVIEDGTLEVFKGKAKAQGLYDAKEVSIGRGFFEEGCITKKHFHGVTEHLIVYKGIMNVKLFKPEDQTNGKLIGERTIKEGQSICINPDIRHIVEFYEDTEIVVVTIPREQ